MQSATIIYVSQNIVHAYNRTCEPLLRKFDLSQVSFDILMFLANNPEYSTAQEISEYRHIKKNLVSVHVEKLVSAGLLQRGSVAGDRRKVSLSCTEKARPIVEEGLKMQELFYEKVTEGISENQWNVCKEIYETIEANAEAMGNKNLIGDVLWVDTR